MDLQRFTSIVRSAEKIAFAELLPRYFKKYGTGRSLVRQMLGALEDNAVYSILDETSLLHGWWLSRWLDKRRLRTAAEIQHGVPVRVIAGRTEECQFSDHHIDEDIRGSIDEGLYEQLTAFFPIPRMAAFHRELISATEHFGILGQPLHSTCEKWRQWIEVYFVAWQWLDASCGGQLFADQDYLRIALGYVLFNEIAHAIESVPGYADNAYAYERNWSHAKADEAQIYRNLLTAVTGPKQWGCSQRGGKRLLR
jgi:hypothetical protein